MGVVALKEEIFKFLLWAGVVVLEELIFNNWSRTIDKIW